MSKKELNGKVVKDKNDKTVVVLVKRRFSHPFFKIKHINGTRCRSCTSRASTATAAARSASPTRLLLALTAFAAASAAWPDDRDAIDDAALLEMEMPVAAAAARQSPRDRARWARLGQDLAAAGEEQRPDLRLIPLKSEVERRKVSWSLGILRVGVGAAVQ